jgi:imidazolonepropionase
MAKGGVTAMCLPATSFYLNKTFAPAKEMIEKGIPVAMASDFNPGSCPSLNLQFVINLGCLKYKLTPEEVLTAVTINPACAIGLGEKVGTAEVGKQADLVIWDAHVGIYTGNGYYVSALNEGVGIIEIPISASSGSGSYWGIYRIPGAN